MTHAKDGSALVLCLVIMALAFLLVTTSFKNALLLDAMSRTRTIFQQEQYLLKGLMIYGITLCHQNSKLLFAWGNEQAQTMHIRFDSWPSPETVPLLGPYQGTISITSYKQSLHLESHLCRNNASCMSSNCTVVIRDPKRYPGTLMISSWSMTNGA